MTKAFISYNHTDEKIVKKLHVHLANLKRDGIIEAWHDEQILPGANLDQSISSALNESGLFIAIVSPDYLNSHYCFDKEFQRALQLQSEGKIIIVPIIAEPCDWLNSAFNSMKAVPQDGKPISEWTNDNAAYLNITSELRRVLSAVSTSSGEVNRDSIATAPARSYKVERDFTQVDIINFRNASISEIKKFFVESIAEINTVDEIQAIVLSEGTDSFTCLISNRAKIDCNGYVTVYIPTDTSFHRSAILSYVLAENHQQNSFQTNNLFSVENDRYNLYWSNRDFFGQSEKKSWTSREIAEHIWNEFIEQVGIRVGS